MNDLIARLRMLRAESESINATLVDDLKPFFGPTKPMFRRLPDSNEKRRNVTTTCSCLMSLATSGKIIQAFTEIKGIESKAEAQSFVTEVFEHTVNSPWMSSGLDDLNAFSSLIVLRAAGLLTRSDEAPLKKKALQMIHPKYVWNGDQPKEVGPSQTLMQIYEDKIQQAPDSFRVGAYPPTAAIAYWFADAAENLSLVMSDDSFERITLWASQEFARQVSLVASEHDAMKDPMAMAAAACLSWRLRNQAGAKKPELRDKLMRVLPTEIEIKRAVLKSFDSQQNSGIWPKYFPLFNYGMGEAGSNYFFSFELLEVILGEFEKSDLLEEKVVLDGIEKALSWCKSNRLVHRNGDDIYKGWNSGGQITTLKEGKPESWPTAVIHMFLSKLQSAFSWQIKRLTLQKYDAVPPEFIKPNDKEWNNFVDSPISLPDEETTVKKVIAEEILKQIKKPGKDIHVRDSIKERRSVLLFGPPGTAKTSLVRAVSSKIGWPLIELNPSNFLGKGLENIYQQVGDVFTDLNDVWGAVVFFDEMDALASKRTDTIDVTRQLLTTSLLPKLSKLHGDKRVLFFMATNHLRNFDSAIKRPGRFDLLICMAPPMWEEKLKNLKSFLKDDVSEEDCESLRQTLATLAVAEEIRILLNFFTYADFKSLLEHISKPTNSRPSVETMTVEQFNKLVKDWAENFIALHDREVTHVENPSPRLEFKTDLNESRRQ
jgi:hypothetical protein